MSPDLRLLIDLVGLALVGAAFLALIAAWIWLTVLALQTHQSWGAVLFFLPWYVVAYAIDKRKQARSPALLALAACLCMGFVSVADELIEWKYGPASDQTSASPGSTPHRH